MRKLTFTVLSIGILSSLVGGSIYVLEINRWFLVYLQFGIAYLVVGGTAYFERTRYATSPPRLLLVLLVPGVVTGTLVAGLLATGTPVYDVYPFVPPASFIVVWVVAAFLVPLQYALERPIDDRYRWAVAAVTVLVIAAPVVYYVTTVHPTQVGDELASLSLVIGLGFWVSVPVYNAGRTVPPDPDRRTRSVRPAIALAAVVALTLLATTSVLGLVVPTDLGSMLLAGLVYGPVVYVGVRGMSTLNGLRA